MQDRSIIIQIYNCCRLLCANPYPVKSIEKFHLQRYSTCNEILSAETSREVRLIPCLVY